MANPRDELAALLDKDTIINHAGHDSDCQKWVIANGPAVLAMYDEAERLREALRQIAEYDSDEAIFYVDIARAALDVERLRGALERIGWHELTWAEARDVARAALDGKEEGYDPA